jgi:hypothetical protein
MKNKPDPALLRPSNLSNEIKKRAPKSRKTIPLTSLYKIVNTSNKPVFSFDKAGTRKRVFLSGTAGNNPQGKWQGIPIDQRKGAADGQ